MSKAILIDTTKCIGCRSCQVSCKEWNGLRGEKTALPRAGLGLQNPVTLSSNTLTLMTYREVADAGAPGGLRYIFAKRQCMHCDDPACASACPVTALHKTAEGAVIYDSGKCIGCRYCVWACPFGAPTVQWDSLTPEIRKCTRCYDRTSQPAPEERNGRKLTEEEKKRFVEQEAIPACVKQCPAGALKYGERNALLAEAKGRIQAHPQKYVDHIYGEHEAGGTSTFYLSSAPFAALGFPQVESRPYPAVSVPALRALPLSVVGMGALLGGSYALYQRRATVTETPPVSASAGAAAVADGPFKPIRGGEQPAKVQATAAPGKLLPALNELLKFLVGFGAILFLLRLAGLSVSVQLSEAYSWMRWMDLNYLWLGTAAAALATAGLISILRTKKFGAGGSEVFFRPSPGKEERHVEFAPVPGKAGTKVEGLLKILIAFGLVSFLFRFAVGLGGSTNLSDTYPWGLWIAFLLIRIAISAGSFVGAGMIYVAGRKDLYPTGRTAVLLGSLSYASVLVTLIADVGRPWNAWQLVFQAPMHSAMFEVAWCLSLYLLVLMIEFLPVPFERWGLARAAAEWRRYSPAFVVASITGFVYLMSRSLAYTALALVVFGILAYTVRARAGEEAAPALLAIAGVVFASMHQSSLGSLFLLMPDKLNALWWTPLLPLNYFLSSLAAGTALVILIQMWIAKGYRRRLEIGPAATLGKLTLAFLFAYEVVRWGDVIYHGQLPQVLAGTAGNLFLAEMGLLGIVPLVLLRTEKWRQQPAILGTASMLTVLGVVLNRVDTVFFAMNLKGPMPQIAPVGYFPSVWEWGLSAGMVAGAIWLFRWAAQNMPVLPKEEVAVPVALAAD